MNLTQRLFAWIGHMVSPVEVPHMQDFEPDLGSKEVVEGVVAPVAPVVYMPHVYVSDWTLRQSIRDKKDKQKIRRRGFARYLFGEMDAASPGKSVTPFKTSAGYSGFEYISPAAAQALEAVRQAKAELLGS